jgi:hypothetical protein
VEHVHMTQFTAVFLVLAVLRGGGEAIQHEPLWGLLIVGGAVAAAVTRSGFLLLSITAFAATTVGPVPSSSLVLIGWVAAALALFDQADLEHVLRVQVVVVYGFAASHKVVSPEFLSGDMLVEHARWAWWPQGMALAAIAAEAGLAFAVWRRLPGLAWVVAPMHAVFVVSIATGWAHALSLTAFNGLLVALVWSTSPDRVQVRKEAVLV